MLLDPIHAECDHCGSSFISTPKRTFLGFQQLTCENCQRKIAYPLTPGFRITYWIIAALLLISIVNAFGNGGYAYPGGAGLAILYAIYRDQTLRKRISIQASQPTRNQPIRSSIASYTNKNTCATCNEEAPAHMKFCPECGTKLTIESSVTESVFAAPSNPVQNISNFAQHKHTIQLLNFIAILLGLGLTVKVLSKDPGTSIFGLLYIAPFALAIAASRSSSSIFLIKTSVIINIICGLLLFGGLVVGSIQDPVLSIFLVGAALSALCALNIKSNWNAAFGKNKA